MDVEVAQSRDRMLSAEQPPPYTHTAATVPNTSGLPAYRDDVSPPQVFPRRSSRAVADAQDPTLNSQLQSSRVYRRATVDHNGYPFSPQPYRRRSSQIDTSDPNFCFPQDGDDTRTAMLREFARSKLYANDYWGGQKGAVTGEANEPPKLFKWMKRKLSGSHKGGKSSAAPERNSETEGQYAVDGEIGRGDIDTSRII